MSEPIKLTLQLNKVTTMKDGGSRLIFDCGNESLEAVQKLVALNSVGDTNLACVIVPYKSTSIGTLDSKTGEIIFNY